MLESADGMTPQLPTMTPEEFAGRWHDAGFGERQGAQSFFNDLCGLESWPETDRIMARGYTPGNQG